MSLEKKSELILHKIGNENYGSYHEDSQWGQDILKVGNSLGLGGIARIENDQLFHFEVHLKRYYTESIFLFLN